MIRNPPCRDSNNMLITRSSSDIVLGSSALVPVRSLAPYSGVSCLCAFIRGCLRAFEVYIGRKLFACTEIAAAAYVRFPCTEFVLEHN